VCSIVLALAVAAEEPVKIAVRISVARIARRSRIACVIVFTPMADGAGCCVQLPGLGEPFASIGPLHGRSRVLHHLLCSSFNV
jgi:hypothetical protein